MFHVQCNYVHYVPSYKRILSWTLCIWNNIFFFWIWRNTKKVIVYDDLIFGQQSVSIKTDHHVKKVMSDRWWNRELTLKCKLQSIETMNNHLGVSISVSQYFIISSISVSEYCTWINCTWIRKVVINIVKPMWVFPGVDVQRNSSASTRNAVKKNEHIQLGGAVASWLVRSPLDEAVWVQSLAKWVPANLMLGVTLLLASIPSREEYKYSYM